MQTLSDMLRQARELSWKHLGREITFYLPGMFICNSRTGRYPAVSITGNRCTLGCDHCRSRILESMIPAVTPADLLKRCVQLKADGNVGVLLSGGCDANGRLPWDAFIAAIREIKLRTDLFISVHSGLLDVQTARALKAAGVDQALIDVVGDDRTFKDIYHVDFGVARIYDSLQALQLAGLAVVPHIVCGLHYGEIKGERAAIAMVSQLDVEQLVIVSLMRIRGTPLWHTNPLPAEAVAEMIAEARLEMPRTRISLGCARQRGNTDLEILAIDAGVNRLALPSEEAVAHARDYGLQIHYQYTCCSVSQQLHEPQDEAFFE